MKIKSLEAEIERQNLKMKSLEGENEKLRRQLDQDKPKSSKYTQVHTSSVLQRYLILLSSLAV